MTKTVIRIVQTDRPTALVPLAGKGHAELYLDDFQDLLKLGVSPRWNQLNTGYVTAPCSKAPGNNIQIARVMLDASPGFRVRYGSFNRADLRRENVSLIAGYGSSRRDRDFLSGKDQTSRVEYQYD